MASALASGARGRGFESRLPDHVRKAMKRDTGIAKKRVHAYYGGRVQGIGFRYTAERIARDMDVNGWVRNLPDGRVELLCEADEKTLSDFLDKIKNGVLKSYIRDTEVEWSCATGEFKNFDIRFW